MEYSQNANIQKLFFSKDVISELNKILLQNFNNTNFDRNIREEIIKLLIKNMKIVYRSIDINKINTGNQSIIFDKFKKQSIVLSFSDVKRLLQPSTFDNQSSDMKYNRDFNSIPTPGNKVMDRPNEVKRVEKTKSPLQSDTTSRKKTNENTLERHRVSNPDYDASFSNELNNVFKPLVQTNDLNMFNNYNFDNKSIDVSGKMDEIKKMRSTEIITNKLPEVPDFLKSVSSFFTGS